MVARPIQLVHLVRDFRHGGMENGVVNLVNHHIHSGFKARFM